MDVRENETDAQEILKSARRNVSGDVIFRRRSECERLRGFQDRSIFHRQRVFGLYERDGNADVQRNGFDRRRKPEKICRPAGIDRCVHPGLQVDVPRTELRKRSNGEGR